MPLRQFRRADTGAEWRLRERRSNQGPKPNLDIKEVNRVVEYAEDIQAREQDRSHCEQAAKWCGCAQRSPKDPDQDGDLER